MPEISITLVDHTTDTRDSLKVLIQKHLADIFADLLFSDSEATVVNTRWTSGSPGAGDQDLVLHFVEDIAHSYVQAQMPGGPINPVDGGVTRPRPDKTGSEFYKFPFIGGKRTRFHALGYAKLAAHEAMHNMTRMNNDQLHPRGGIGASPPQTVNDNNRSDAQAALGTIPNQLL
jgi:hypothetical protein